MSRSRHPARTRCGGRAFHTVQRGAAALTGQRAEQGRPSLQGIYAILARLPAACGRNNATEQSQRNAAAAAHHRIVGYCRSGAGAGSAMASGLAGELASRRDRRSPAAAGVLPVGLAHYPQWRDFPDRPGTTRLSPYLHFGEISARQAVWTLQDYSQRAEGPGLLQATEALIRQLGWREFAHHVLQHFPHTSEEPLNPVYAIFLGIGTTHYCGPGSAAVLAFPSSMPACASCGKLVGYIIAFV